MGIVHIRMSEEIDTRIWLWIRRVGKVGREIWTLRERYLWTCYCILSRSCVIVVLAVAGLHIIFLPEPTQENASDARFQISGLRG